MENTETTTKKKKKKKYQIAPLKAVVGVDWPIKAPPMHTVSHFSYARLFQGPHFLTKMLESNIPYDNLFIDILSV